ncbi:hypothetical protein BDM02DRAFT_3259278 [Thelephora ganbajun]|uniref:Uncharacterized protein n=1 Tax=Thelephora ganbajun TaxID=370292 RepID=A0ACB6ZNT9_THEGA|nr:hypothetical protein BDM02DRAFT_3259278 [Thelephora ganbajun]
MTEAVTGIMVTYWHEALVPLLVRSKGQCSRVAPDLRLKTWMPPLTLHSSSRSVKASISELSTSSSFRVKVRRQRQMYIVYRVDPLQAAANVPHCVPGPNADSETCAWGTHFLSLSDHRATHRPRPERFTAWDTLEPMERTTPPDEKKFATIRLGASPKGISNSNIPARARKSPVPTQVIEDYISDERSPCFVHLWGGLSTSGQRVHSQVRPSIQDNGAGSNAFLAQ